MNIKNLYKQKIKACEDCDSDVPQEDGVYEISMEQLAEMMPQFESVGMELEKHMYSSRTLYLNDEVCAETVDHIVMLIHKWNRDDATMDVDDRMPIFLYIDTAGGDLMKATTLVSAIENSVTPVIGYAEGIVMSAGLWIFLACHYRIATRHSDFMYHELRASSNEMSTLKEIQNTAKYYERLQNKIDSFIIETTNITQEMLDEKKNSNVDWFIDPKDLEDLGIVDELL